MRESRPYGSVRGARDETRVPTATHRHIESAGWLVEPGSRYRSVELTVHPGAREYREESELLVEPWRDRLRFQSTLINFNNLTEKVARSDAEQPPLQRQS